MRSGKSLVTRCPVCDSCMRIVELECESCGASVRSRFEIPELCRLPPDLYDFLLVFVKNRGVIRDVERELGISYPTVRSRLDAALAALGWAGRSGAGEPTVDKESVIARLEQGEITAEQAERMLRGEEPGDGSEGSKE